MPRGVFTSTVPVVAPWGTVVLMKEAETTSKTAAVPLKLTLVAAEFRSVPRILTAVPAWPEVGSGFHERAETYRQAERRACCY